MPHRRGAATGARRYFGEMALVDDTPRSADGIAHTDCVPGHQAMSLTG